MASQPLVGKFSQVLITCHTASANEGFCAACEANECQETAYRHMRRPFVRPHGWVYNPMGFGLCWLLGCCVLRRWNRGISLIFPGHIQTKRGIRRSSSFSSPAMASEPEPEPVPQAANADKPPLVCAPCWICLEDGPDEAGEPLVRDCACRGETSAGYHLSCIVQYATSKLDKLLSDECNKDVPFSMGDIYMSDFTMDWRQCPNCRQPYTFKMWASMARALIQFTEDRNLPKTHYVWFEALVNYAHCLTITSITSRFSSQLHNIEEKLVVARNQIDFLLDFVKKECSTLAAEWWDDESKGELLKEVQTGKLLFILGRSHQIHGENLKRMGKTGQPAREEFKSALLCFENAIDNFQAARGRGLRFSFKIQETEDFIKDVKFQLGLISADQRIEDYRKELKDLQNNDADTILIISCKRNLSEALIEKDPPEYFEAIKLKSEILIWFQRELGPDHEVVIEERHLLLTLKQKYREHLGKLKSSS